MNKSDLISAVAANTGLSKAATGKALDAVLEVIGDSLMNDESVQLVGFGTFKTSERKARTGRNPQTGEAIQIAASRVPIFSAGKTLKESLNK